MEQSSQKCRNIIPVLGVILLYLFSASPVKAAVYKCEGSNGKIVYSDTPCHSSSTQTVTDIRPDAAGSASSNPGTSNSGKKQSVVMSQLDDAIKSALIAEDFDRAEALAVNNEQRTWIAAAKKGSAGKSAAGSTVNDLVADKGDSAECRQAKLSLEQEANSTFHKADVLSAKKSLMLAACGINENADTEEASTYVNQHVPFLFDTHRRHSNRNLDRWHHNPRPPHPPPYTSPPYDRHKAKPFGSSYIRPQPPEYKERPTQ